MDEGPGPHVGQDSSNPLLPKASNGHVIDAAKVSVGPGVAEYENRVLLYTGRKRNILSCVINLILCQLGMGALTLPSTYVEVGWEQGIAMTVIFALTSVLSLYLLDQTCRALPSTAKISSIAGVVAATFGKSGAAALEFLMFLLSFGVMTAYFGPIGVELRVVAKAAYEWQTGCALDVSEVHCAMLSVVLIIFPLTLLPEQKVQGYIGATATSCTLFIMVVIAASAPWVSLLPPLLDTCGLAPPSLAGGHTDPVAWVSSLEGVLRAAPIFVFSYNGPTGFLPIRAHLWTPVSDPSRGVGRRKVLAVIFIGQALVMINYVFIAFMGYMTFCGSTPANVLDGYPVAAFMPLMARFALALQLMLVVTGAWLPLNRGAVVSFIYGLGAELPGLPMVAMITAVSVALPLMVSALLGGSLALPLGLTSSICLTTFIFVLPGLVAFRSRALGKGFFALALPLAFAVFGVFVGTISTMVLLRNAHHG